MVTLERIVESIKIQIKPHLTDDVIILDEWLIDIINQSRSAMLRKVFVSGENLTPFYQELKCVSVLVNKINIGGSTTIPTKFPIAKISCPNILGSAGKKNIQYLGSEDYSMTDIHYVSFEEFIAYQYHRFGSTQPCFTEVTDGVLIRNSKQQERWLIRTIFANPMDVQGYDYYNSRYPIDETNLRQLEIITFQHIAQKLGMPVDVINNGQDETVNAPVSKQVQQSNQEEQ